MKHHTCKQSVTLEMAALSTVMTKKNIKKLKQTVQLAESGLMVDETYKHRIIIIGVPTLMSENEVYKCIYKQNIVEKFPELTKNSFMTYIKLSHNQAR